MTAIRVSTSRGIRTDRLVRVFRGDKEVPYQGPLFRRPQPQQSHYVELGANEQLTGEVDLASMYDLGQGGEFEVEALPLGPEAVLEPELEMHVDASALIEVDSRRAAQALEAVSVKTQALTVQSCTELQHWVLAVAQNEASAYAYEAALHYYVNGHDARAQRWFGSASPNRVARVSQVLSAIYTRLNEDSLNYTCDPNFARNLGFGCGQDTLAVTYPWPFSPDMIQLCPGYWSLPETGVYSKADTLVHEISHLYWTVDWAYEAGPAQTLAARFPGRAVENAESYAFYSVNHLIP